MNTQTTIGCYNDWDAAKELVDAVLKNPSYEWEEVGYESRLRTCMATLSKNKAVKIANPTERHMFCKAIDVSTMVLKRAITAQKEVPDFPFYTEYLTCLYDDLYVDYYKLYKLSLKPFC